MQEATRVPFLHSVISRFPLLHLCLAEGCLEMLGNELIVTDFSTSHTPPPDKHPAAEEPYRLSGDGRGKKFEENAAGPWFIGYLILGVYTEFCVKTKQL